MTVGENHDDATNKQVIKELKGKEKVVFLRSKYDIESGGQKDMNRL